MFMEHEVPRVATVAGSKKMRCASSIHWRQHHQSSICRCRCSIRGEEEGLGTVASSCPFRFICWAADERGKRRPLPPPLPPCLLSSRAGGGVGGGRAARA